MLSSHTHAKGSALVLPAQSSVLRTQVWKASLLLADWLQHHRALFPEPLGTVLELGAGVGVPSLVAASLGCCATATDAEPAALLLARRNAAANRSAASAAGGSVRVALLDWASAGLPADVAVPEQDARATCLHAADATGEGQAHTAASDCGLGTRARGHAGELQSSGGDEEAIPAADWQSCLSAQVRAD